MDWLDFTDEQRREVERLAREHGISESAIWSAIIGTPNLPKDAMIEDMEHRFIHRNRKVMAPVRIGEFEIETRRP